MNLLSRVLLALFCFFTFQLKAQIFQQDSLALVQLYDSTNGKNWTIKTNWKTALPVTKWFGISVVGNRVTSIVLPNNNLTGHIPSAIGNLTQLTFDLRLENNSITGSIPASIGNLTILKQLNFAGNQLSGVLPQEIGNLAKITYLDVSFNKITGNIPATIGGLNQLSSLFLNVNKLSGNIPSTICFLPNLLFCYLDYNQLSGGIPPQIGNLTSLKTFSASNNQLSGNIPFSIGNLGNLATLDVSVNQLSDTLPPTIGNLTNLINLKLQYNQFNGFLPKVVGDLPKLVSCYLNNNRFKGKIPSGFSTNANLTNFQLQNNQFTFAGIEDVASKATYSPQAIIPLQKKGTALLVEVGGNPANNVFTWYRNGIVTATIPADSSFIPSSTGKYHVTVSNAVANMLVLSSDTISITTLPINLIMLRGTISNGNALLSWQTTEKLHFTVEYSVDARDFIGIKIDALTNSINGIINVQASVTHFGVNYFRIKGVNQQGEVGYSNTIGLFLGNQANELITSVFPNPARTSIHIRGGGSIKALAVYAFSGKQMPMSFTQNNTSIQISNYPKGYYFIQVMNAAGKKEIVPFEKN